jgi:hypothetical protein
MRIEIIAFYPLNKKNKKKVGTIHAYLPDVDIDVRGIGVFTGAKGNFFIQPPSMVGDDKIKYPCISFVNMKTQEDFIITLRKKCNFFLKTWKDEEEL